MRPHTALFSAIFFPLMCASCSKNEPIYRTDATIRQVMDSLVEPNADFLWDAVETRATKEGIFNKEPKSDDDWNELREHAISLMEATNVIQIPNRRVAKPDEKAGDPRIEEPPEVIQTMIDSDRGTWAKHAHELYDSVGVYLKAVDNKSVDGVVDASEKMDKACESCHLVYWYPNEAKGKSGSVRPKQ